jgi:hypothetical protein
MRAEIYQIAVNPFDYLTEFWINTLESSQDVSGSEFIPALTIGCARLRAVLPYHARFAIPMYVKRVQRKLKT